MFPSCHITRLFRKDEDLSGSTKDKVSCSERGLGSEHDKWAWILNRQNIVEGSQKEYMWVEMQIIKDHSDHHTTNLDLIPFNFDNDTSDKDEVESNNSISAAIPMPGKSSSGQSSRICETPSIESSYSVQSVATSLNSRNDNIDDRFKQQNEKDIFSVEPLFSPIMTSMNQSVDIKDSGRVVREHQTNSCPSVSNTGLCSIITMRHSTNRLSSPLRKPKLSCVSKASSGYASYSGGTLSSSKSCPSLISLGAQSSAKGKVPGFRSQDPLRVQNVTSYSDLERLRESAYESLCKSDPQKLQHNRIKENCNYRPTCRHYCGDCYIDFDDIRGASFDASSVETSDASTSPHLPLAQIWKNGASSAEQCRCAQGVINPVTVEKLGGPQVRKVCHSYEYDAFLDYNIQDEKWAFSLLEILEGPKYNFRIYLHERDKVLGKRSIDEIENQLQNSFKYICLLSPHFLNSREVDNLHMAKHERKYNRPFSNYIILLKIAPCEVPPGLKPLDWEDCCTRKACKDGPDRYVVDKVVKAIRDVT